MTPAEPLFGALFVGATCAVGARFGQRIGVASALLAACSPVFLYQLVQPMSEVPAAALWMLSAAAVTGTRRHAAAVGGLAAGAAILIRPNLFPVALPLVIFILWRPERAWRDRLRAAATFGVCAVLAWAAVAVIQRAPYGSALVRRPEGLRLPSSRYGSLEALFGIDHVAPNAARYASWLSQTHTPAWVLAAAAPFLLPGALTRLFVALCLVNLACSLPFGARDDWSSLRFLLPTIPLLVILILASIDAACRRTAPQTARRAVAMAAVVLAALWVREAWRLVP